MGRRLLAFGLTVAIQAAALSAPLVHAHLDDQHADHHGANRIHAHLGGHGAAHHAEQHSGPAMHAEEVPERAVTMPLFVAAQAEAPMEPAIAATSFDPPASPVSIVGRSFDDVRSHGPPVCPSIAPRAPPHLPS